MTQNSFQTNKIMDTRLLLDTIKEKTGINTDKALAEEIGIKYPTWKNK